MNKTKSYSDCYLYNKYPMYNKILFEAMMHSEFIDKDVDSFKDVEYEVKRTKVSEGLIRVLKSPKTVLLIPDKPLPKPFASFVAIDPRSKKERKLFIDTTNCINKTDKGYIVNDIRLISHLIGGYFEMYYLSYGSSKAYTHNGLITESQCFSALFTHIIDYIGKISIVDGARDKCLYLSSRYFFEGIYGVDVDRSRKISAKYAGISDSKEAIYFMNSDDDKETFTDINKFVKLIKNTFKLDKLTLDILVEKWMFLYGPSTVFALEYGPAFVKMIIDAYIGSYLNNQKTIEKVCGKNMVVMAKGYIDRI